MYKLNSPYTALSGVMLYSSTGRVVGIIMAEVKGSVIYVRMEISETIITIFVCSALENERKRLVPNELIIADITF